MQHRARVLSLYIYAHVAASSDALLAFAAIFDVVVRELVNNGVECAASGNRAAAAEKGRFLSTRNEKKRKGGEI